MDTLTKVCTRCKSPKALTEYYARSGHPNPSEAGHYISECKACMRERSRALIPLPPTEPRAATEILAINYLRSKGIPSLPGKAVSHAHVDVVAFGCIRIEVKWARLDFHRSSSGFKFSTTPSQVRDGYRGDVVMLVCDYGDGRTTYHLFPANHPVFYMDGRLKHGFTFVPGLKEATRHGHNRVVMTQPLMDEYMDNTNMLWQLLYQRSTEIASEFPSAEMSNHG